MDVEGLSGDPKGEVRLEDPRRRPHPPPPPQLCGAEVGEALPGSFVWSGLAPSLSVSAGSYGTLFSAAFSELVYSLFQLKTRL